MLLLWAFYLSKNPNKIDNHKNIKLHNYNNNSCFLSSNSAY